MPVCAHAGIERRYSSVPIEWYEKGHGWAERNALYLEHVLAAELNSQGPWLARPAGGRETLQLVWRTAGRFAATPLVACHATFISRSLSVMDFEPEPTRNAAGPPWQGHDGAERA